MATVKTLGTLTRIFSAERLAPQRDFNLHRIEVQPVVILQQGLHEVRPAMDALGRVAGPASAEDHQHAVARASFIGPHHHGKESDHDDASEQQEGDEKRVHCRKIGMRRYRLGQQR